MEDKKIKVDLACGDNKHGEDWIGVDIAQTSAVDIQHDLNHYPWPFEDESVDEIHCSHYIEHIPHDSRVLDLFRMILRSENLDSLKDEISRYMDEDKPSEGLINFMNECYRILKPEGKISLIAPYYSSIRAYGDPTHQRFICDWTFYYYNKQWRELNKLEHYGIIADFDVKYDFHISEEMSLKSEEVRNEAFLRYWNTVDDIMVKLKKN